MALARPILAGPASPEPAGNRVRLDTLVRLRWLAVTGQLFAICTVAFAFGFAMPLVPALALVGLSAALNLFLVARFSEPRRLEARQAALLLGYDSLQLAGLLFLTGGLANPFAILLLAPVSVSATTLPRRWTVLLGLGVIGLASVLAIAHLPLPWAADEPLTLPPLYLIGIWVALTSGVIFIAAYTMRVASEARQIETALQATEMVLAREQHISRLDGMAAAAAHELGTPLATIALTAREMESDLSGMDALQEDLRLIREQTERCRTILARLGSIETDGGDIFGEVPLSEMIEEAAAPHRDFGVSIKVIRTAITGDEPRFTRTAALLYGLGNIVENAVDFATKQVEIALSWDAEAVSVTIADDGPGFSPDLIGRIGEPYVTTRPRAGDAERHDEYGGLGLGIFIAKTLLERSGARLEFANRSGVPGARVHLTWPRVETGQTGGF